VIGDSPVSFIDSIFFALVIWAQWSIASWMLAASARRGGPARKLILAFLAGIGLLLATGITFQFHGLVRFLHPNPWLRGFVGGVVFLWLFNSTGAFLIHRIWLLMQERVGAPDFDPKRRKLVSLAGSALAAAPFAMGGYGTFIERTNFHIREVDVPISNLPPDLQGLRILQLSDIHIGPFLSERDLARVVDESRNLRPHLATITGDLITMGGDPLDACLRQIARLRAEAGILGCMGNHEAYANAQGYTVEQGGKLGINFLRDRARTLKFGTATLNVAGVDYQSVSKRANYLTGVERFVAPGTVNLLLAHNPDVFPVAARKGFDLTLSGHTHGGQVTVEILNQYVNVARFFTPFVSGYYRLAQPSGSAASLYVTRGVGTIALPIRLGAPPEISLLKLTRA